MWQESLYCDYRAFDLDSERRIRHWEVILAGRGVNAARYVKWERHCRV